MTLCRAVGIGREQVLAPLVEVLRDDQVTGIASLDGELADDLALVWIGARHLGHGRSFIVVTMS
jgi:hypothetical protein